MLHYFFHFRLFSVFSGDHSNSSIAKKVQLSTKFYSTSFKSVRKFHTKLKVCHKLGLYHFIHRKKEKTNNKKTPFWRDLSYKVFGLSQKNSRNSSVLHPKGYKRQQTMHWRWHYLSSHTY